MCETQISIETKDLFLNPKDPNGVAFECECGLKQLIIRKDELDSTDGRYITFPCHVQYDSRFGCGKVYQIIVNKEEILKIKPRTMKEFEVWTEGYSATGNESGAVLHGKFAGDTFKDAVTAFKDSLTDEHSKACVNVETMKFWGCRFFDNGSDARNSFG